MGDLDRAKELLGEYLREQILFSDESAKELRNLFNSHKDSNTFRGLDYMFCESYKLLWEKVDLAERLFKSNLKIYDSLK